MEGLNSGFMIVQYSAAALVSENKVLAHPASVDSMQLPPANQGRSCILEEQFASRKAMEILDKCGEKY